MGAFALGVRLRPAAAAAGASAESEVRLFVAIRPDGRTLLTSHRSEMGQHVWTAMAQVIADELDGWPRWCGRRRPPKRACVTPLRRVEGAAVTTIEGAEGRIAEALRAAWIDLQVPQCGFCQAGQLMSAVALLKAVPTPDDAAIDRGMNGNLCRCATYTRIRAAIHQAARAVK